MRLIYLPLKLLPVALLAGSAAAQSAPNQAANDRRHDTDAWKIVEQHLPDPATATAQTLETEGDILRARRFPEDALDYYNHALEHGGSPSRLLNKLGLTELELHNGILAHAYFIRAIKLNKKDPEAWNNLGAAEYLGGNPLGAIADYKKAIALNRRDAVFHANLSTVYFERRDFKGARQQIALALKLDPAIFDRDEGQGGIAAHVLSTDDRARFSFEMARMYARAGLESPMLHSLAMASEAGMDIRREMARDPVLAKFVTDPRVLTMVHTADALRVSRDAKQSTVPPAIASTTDPQP